MRVFTEEKRQELRCLAEYAWRPSPGSFEKWTGSFDWSDSEPGEWDRDDHRVTDFAEKLVAAVHKSPMRWTENLASGRPVVRIHWNVGAGLVEVDVHIVEGKVVATFNDAPGGSYSTPKAAATALNKHAR